MTYRSDLPIHIENILMEKGYLSTHEYDTLYELEDLDLWDLDEEYYAACAGVDVYGRLY